MRQGHTNQSWRAHRGQHLKYQGSDFAQPRLMGGHMTPDSMRKVSIRNIFNS